MGDQRAPQRCPRHSELLLVHEITCALDSDSEHAIRQELVRLSRNRTILIIAHRLPSIVRAHGIIVVKRGRTVEQGSSANQLQEAASQLSQ